MREVPERVQFILTEDALLEADGKTESEYEFTYIFAGSRYEEEDFKQKLILLVRSLGSISTYAAIPEAVDIIIHGLKEGAKIRGIAFFSVGTTPVIVKAKKILSSNTSNPDNPTINTES